jgi:hypothetical protein
MTIPYERTRALIEAYELLKRLQDPQNSPRVPRWLREEARKLLRHYPNYATIELAHKALPLCFGPAPPFSRMTGSVEVLAVIAASTAGAEDAPEPKTSGAKPPKSGV